MFQAPNCPARSRSLPFCGTEILGGMVSALHPQLAITGKNSMMQLKQPPLCICWLDQRGRMWETETWQIRDGNSGWTTRSKQYLCLISGRNSAHGPVERRIGGSVTREGSHQSLSPVRYHPLRLINLGRRLPPVNRTTSVHANSRAACGRG
jgi:hypothetical protein